MVVKSVVRSALENHNTVNKNSNEVYFVSKQACASEREREREREREIGRERGRGKRVKNSKNSNQRGVLRLQPSLCKASERERGGEKERQA